MTRIDTHQSSKLTFAESAAPSTPASGLVLVYAKTDGKLYIKDDAGTETDLTAAGSGFANVSARAKRTAGNLTLNNTSWTDVPSIGTLTVAAAENDVLLFSVSLLWGAEAVACALDIQTVTGSNWVGASGGAGDFGISGWWGFATTDAAAENLPVSGSVQYVVAAGDISGGNVQAKLRYKTSAASNKTLFASTTIPLVWSVVNLGQ